MSQDKKPDDMKQAQHDANRDPLSGVAGAHPVGTGVGAAVGGVAAGAATGAAIGTVAGPVGTAIGTAVGAAVGAVVGGAAGKAVAEDVNPTVEHGFWSQNYSNRPYARSGETYDQYGPAYQYGWESQSKYGTKKFDEVESNLQRDWDKARNTSKLEWNRARDAVRDSWDRVSQRRANRDMSRQD